MVSLLRLKQTVPQTLPTILPPYRVLPFRINLHSGIACAQWEFDFDFRPTANGGTYYRRYLSSQYVIKCVFTDTVGPGFVVGKR